MTILRPTLPSDRRKFRNTLASKKVTNLDITPEPDAEERAAIEAALVQEPEELPPPSWVEESSQSEP